MRVKPATKFKLWMMANGLTAGIVAEETGISKFSIFAYMRGDRLPSRRTMKRLEEVYDIDTKELFN